MKGEKTTGELCHRNQENQLLLEGCGQLLNAACVVDEDEDREQVIKYGNREIIGDFDKSSKRKDSEVMEIKVKKRLRDDEASR